MKTSVVLKRELLGGLVAQNSNTGMFSATDLTKIGNKWRIANDLDVFTMKSWLANKGTQEFIKELESKYGEGNIKKSARGKGSHTWFHPLLFIDMALAISPKLKIETYEWLFDHLIKSRNESGDTYNLMCGILFNKSKNRSHFNTYIRHTANMIKAACNCTDWQLANETQLKKRVKIHNNIILLADVLNNNDEAIRIALLKANDLEAKI